MQDNALDTIVAAVEQIGVVVAEFVEGHPFYSNQQSPGLQLPRRGYFFGAQLPKKA
jgi:hypothetical protein